MPGHGRSTKSRASVRLVQAVSGLVLCASLVGALLASPAHAYSFRRTLQHRDRGSDVKALEVRVVGWFPEHAKRRLKVNRAFGYRTERAVKAFQRHYGLSVDGIAGPQTFSALNRLEDPNRSTRHFDYAEFKQNRNRSCSAQANAYA
ncbi:MAG: peptidoglycan-binding domain-containing protein, partial [Actinomycetota bacterium]